MDERGRVAGRLEILRQHHSDGLAAELDAVVVERPERRTIPRRHLILVGFVVVRHGWTVLVREDRDDALDFQCRGNIEPFEAASCDRRRHQAGIGKIRRAEFRRIARRAGDLVAPVNPGGCRADIARHGCTRLSGRSGSSRCMRGCGSDCAESRRAFEQRAAVNSCRGGRASLGARSVIDAHAILLSDCDCGVPCAA